MISPKRDREEARRDVIDYIEMFYNPKRRHGHANDVSLVEFEISISTGCRVSSKPEAVDSKPVVQTHHGLRDRNHSLTVHPCLDFTGAQGLINFVKATARFR